MSQRDAADLAAEILTTPGYKVLRVFTVGNTFLPPWIIQISTPRPRLVLVHSRQEWLDTQAQDSPERTVT